MAMDSAKAEVVISVPINKVFGFTSNLNNLPLWGGVTSIEAVEIKPQALGSKYNAIVKTLLSKSIVPLEVTAYSSPTAFTFRDHKTKSDFVYTFEQTGNGTKVKLENIVEGFSLASSDRKLKSLLSNLKKYLEENEAKLAEVDTASPQKKKEQITHRSA